MLLFSLLSALPLHTLDFLPLSSAGQGHTHFAPLALVLFRDVTDNKKKMKEKKQQRKDAQVENRHFSASSGLDVVVEGSLFSVWVKW